MARVRRKIESLDRGSPFRFGGYTVKFNDGPNLYILYKDIFVYRIYHFDAARPDPLILDCGSNIGMSILYFKQRYPRARIIGFEPDPDIIPFLESNITGNKLQDVRWLQAALSRNGKKELLFGWNLRQRPRRNAYTGEPSRLETIRSSMYAPVGLFG